MKINNKQSGSVPIELIVYLACGLLVVGIALIQPFMESRTYNKITGANTTMWDAVWVELRVSERPINQ